MFPYEKFLDGRKTSLSWESFNSDFFCLIRLCWCYRKIHPLSKWVVYNISNEVSWNFKIYKKKKKSLRNVIWKITNVSRSDLCILCYMHCLVCLNYMDYEKSPYFPYLDFREINWSWEILKFFLELTSLISLTKFQHSLL